jgi:RNA polymerase sigma-70 factor (ECF subfamily)
MTDQAPDAELVRRVKVGDLAAVGALATRYERQIYTLAFRIVRQQQDAEDVVRQTFLSVLENLAGFRE